MATIKMCTDIPQSKKLAEFLSLESADMHYHYDNDFDELESIPKYMNEAKKYYADITEVRECIDWLKSLEQRKRIG